jgi:hypothetical protein
MPKRDDGNEQDVRIHPTAEPIEGATENLNVPIGHTGEGCTQGTQTDLTGPAIGATLPTSDLLVLYDWTSIQGICPKGFDIRSLDKLIFKLVSGHFASADTIINSSLKKYIYTNDPNTTKIRIAYNTRFAPASDERTPAIIIKRLAQAGNRIVIGDRSEERDPSEIENGIARYVRQVQGGHRLVAISTVDGEAEALAAECWEFLNCLSPILRRILPLHDFQVMNMGELGIMQDMGNLLGVPIDLAYIYEYAWTLTTQAPKISGIRLDAQVTLA